MMEYYVKRFNNLHIMSANKKDIGCKLVYGIMK